MVDNIRSDTMSKWKKNLCICLTLIITLSTALPTGNVAASINSTSTNNQADTPNTEGVISFTEELSGPLEPTIVPTPEVTVIPTPEVTINPIPEVTVSPTPEVTISPTPEDTISPTPELSITPSPEPTKSPFRSKTLEKMSEYDYIGNSVTGISKKKVAVKTLQKNLLSYGTLYGTGMPYDEYKVAMGYQWQDATEYDKKPTIINVDITKSMNYSAYINTLKKLSRYEGVYIYKIGKSTQGRDLYAVEIDVASDQKKNVFMLTGQIHAREFAGGTYIVKQLVDLIQKAQTDSKTMELLKKNKFVAVPIINVDGREALINEPKKWTTKGGEMYKAYTNGVDGGRNFPGLQWGQVLKGSRYKYSIAKSPGYANYPGSYAGSNRETKAMMKWLYHYIVVEQARYYIDMHQQGSIIYAGKTWQTKTQAQKSWDLRTNLRSVLNKGVTRRKYNNVYEGSIYGMQGEGSSLTDYSVTLAVGAKFSPAYGFHAFVSGNKEYILMQIKDLDRNVIKVKDANKNFAAVTMEIGYGRSYLGNSAATRKLLANEYKNYNYDKLLESLPKMVK
jgi:hypothetical protein